MRRAMVVAASIAAVLVSASAAPTFASYGAFALDESAHKFGYSGNQPDQKHADELAVKNCKSANCKVVFPVGPRQCGALATENNGTAWGGAAKATRDAAQRAAMQDCRKHTSGQCTVRASECNR